MAVLGDHAFVGAGTNGGFASQWNRTPTCKEAASPTPVKVVDLSDPSNPNVAATIDVDAPGAPGKTVPRDVAALHVDHLSVKNDFTGDLLAVALESCNGASDGLVGVNFYDVSNPSNPVLLSHDSRADNIATRDVSLVQRPDGRVFALEANQGSLDGVTGGIHVVDVTAPAAPTQVGSFSHTDTDEFFSFFSTQECRPFNFAQGAAANAAGDTAYVAYQDEELFTLDMANPTGSLPVESHTEYDAAEGNSFRFVPNTDETRALATDEDLSPADTSLTITQGSPQGFTEPGADESGVFRGCEAIWGAPLYQQADSSIDDQQIAFVGGKPDGNGDFGCERTDYDGVDVAGKIVVVFRGGCFFDRKARVAQDPNQDGDTADGGAALLIANSQADHHTDEGSGVLFSPDAGDPGDAGVEIPLAMITQEAGTAIADAIEDGETVKGTLADTADTWGGLRIFDLTGSSPKQVGTFTAPHTTTLPPDDGLEGLYHATNATFTDDGNALVAYMSDGLRLADLSDPADPREAAHYVPPAVADPTGNYPTEPLVVDVATFDDLVVISDINGGLYVLDVDAVPEGCTIVGTPGDDTLAGTDGDDTICGLGGDDTISAGDGADTVLGGDDNDTIKGQMGNDTLEGEAGDDTVRGNRGADEVTGGDGADTLEGNRGDDTLDGVDGVEGNDALNGGRGSDSCTADPRDTIRNCES